MTDTSDQIHSSLESVVEALRVFQEETSTRFSSYSSTKDFGNIALQEAKRVLWQDKRSTGKGRIVYNGVPYTILGTKLYDCQFGPDRKKRAKENKKSAKENMELQPSRGKSASRGPSKKLGCQAKVVVREIIYFPSYKLSDKPLGREKAAISSEIKRLITDGQPLEWERLFILCLPSMDDHSGHPLEQGLNFKMEEGSKVSETIVTFATGTEDVTWRSAYADNLDHTEDDTEEHQPLIDDEMPQVELEQEITDHLSSGEVIVTSLTFTCGSCRAQYDSIGDLHDHIQAHGLGGSYYYDNRSRTAFPKHDAVCNGSQQRTHSQTKRIPNTSLELSINTDGTITEISRNTCFTDYDNEYHDSCSSQENVGRNPECDQGHTLGFDLHSQGQGHASIAPKTDHSYIGGNKKHKVDVQKPKPKRKCKFRKLKEGAIPYTCFKCKLVFESEEFFQSHMRKHLGGLVCHCCDQLFPSLNDLQRHVLEGEGRALKAVEIFVCSNCGLTSMELQGLKAHLCLSDEDVAQERQAVRLHTGAERGEIYTYLPLDVDTAADNVELRVQCEICESQFENETFLIMHSVKHYYVYKCTECWLHFLSEDEQRVHTALCTNSFICAHCGKQFNYQTQLISHYKVHDDENKNPANFKCEKCGKAIQTKKYFNKHMKECGTHKIRERHYKCETCDKKFFYKSNMKNHMKTVHAAAREFICEACGANFKSVWHLQSHFRNKHEKDKPTFFCDLCDATCNNKAIYTRHRNTHLMSSTDKPFKCDICNKGFTRKSSLKTHNRLVMHDRAAC